MNRFVFLLTVSFLFCAGHAFAQSKVKDEPMNLPIIYASGGYDIAGGDMAKSFGNNVEFGAGFLYKTKSKWMFGMDLSFISGTTVKQIPLDNILTPEGFLIGEDGLFAEIGTDVRISERGFKLPVFKAGRFISAPIGKSSVNSGFFGLMGVGFLQHQINYEDVSRSVPQIRGEYKKGYDHLSNGLALTQNLGYMYINRRNHANFFVNFEFTEAFTQNRRSYNFNERRKDSENHLDLLYGIKVGWIFPIYKKVPEDFYYN